MERITKVYLLNVPLENDYKHTLYFNSKSGQESYFQSRIVKSYTDFSYQRKDSFIRVPDHFDDIQNCNYVMYQNTAYSDKWFYGFITEMKYVDDGRTDVYIETDVIQSWYFNVDGTPGYVVKPSFIEREHVDNDTIGLHTQPEGLETGDYVVNHYTKDDTNLGVLRCVMASTVFPGDLSELYGGIVNGMYTGLRYYVLDHVPETPTGVSEMTDKLQKIVNASGPEAVQSIFFAPDFLTPHTNGTVMVDQSEEVESYEKTISKHYDSSGMNGYTPRNNKLYTYPYKFLRVNNGNAEEGIYKYEYFGHYGNYGNPSVAHDCHFKIRGLLCPGCSIRIIPMDYKGTPNNEAEGINLGKFPICNWSSDMYTNWLTQNGVNTNFSILNSTISMVGSAAEKNIGSTVSSIGDIHSAIRQKANAEMQPPQTYGNINAGDVVCMSYNNKFHYYDMSIKQEYARIIDKYFDMFGYQVNLVKIPNVHHRSRYWYTKTIDVNIDGAIPNKDMQVIKNCYNNGITFWRNPTEIQNYDLFNSISNVV